MAVNSLTDPQLEADLKKALEQRRPLKELAPLLLDSLSSTSKSKRQTALRFLQLHPEWTYWKTEFEPWFRNQKRGPWNLLVTWLTIQRLFLSVDDREQLKKLILQQDATYEWSKHASAWESIYPEIVQWRGQARNGLQDKINKMQELLFEELKTWKSQRLREQEERVLRLLNKKFPGDVNLQEEWNRFRENQAFETLNAKLRERRTQEPLLPFEEEVTTLPGPWRQELQTKALADPQLFYDFALQCCFCEDWAWALHLIRQAPASQSRDWLEVEILLRARRFVDVLQALVVIEGRWAHEAETFFATAYLRAQAYYGLGQRQKASEVLESLLASRPLYRQGIELLSLWKGPA
ncbi:MAG: hypothetical protein ACK5Y2_08370 [Bdellovibrionales bacterium]